MHVTVYKTANSIEPFKIWLRNLRDYRAQIIIRTRLSRLSLGNFGDSKSVGEGVIELRINYGPGYRVYCGLDSNNLIVLLLGGDKSTQNKDIDKVKLMWNSYKSYKKKEAKNE